MLFFGYFAGFDENEYLYILGIEHSKGTDRLVVIEMISLTDYCAHTLHYTFCKVNTLLGVRTMYVKSYCPLTFSMRKVPAIINGILETMLYRHIMCALV